MLSLVNLDVVRNLMVEEMELDRSEGKLYKSTRLNQRGIAEYPEILREALENYDDHWLANQIKQRNLLNSTEKRKKKNGGWSTVKVPSNAHHMLAEGEFNRFYCRALCRYAIENDIEALIIYRAKHVSEPQPESTRKIGKSVIAQRLLDDLRNRIGIETALGIPAGPNSGLSVRLPDDANDS